jgi:ribonuclease E
MAKEILINVSEGEECRIALVENQKLQELYMERTSSTSHVGNIYKGRVTNVEPSIQAAFVDFGLGRNGFLHISDLMPTYFGEHGEDIQESVGRKMARRDRPPIQRCLRRGDSIIVQIIKEGIGTKGPTLSTYLSIPGKILVMMPGMGRMGVSKKIEDETERRRLRHILDSLKPPKDAAFIIRTAGVGKTKLEIERDLKYLTRLWETLKKKEKEPGPVELYTEGDLVTRTVRDVFTPDVDVIVIDNKEVAKRVKDVIKISNPRTKNKVELYEEPVPLFHKYGIEREIELMYSRHVPLPSGGSLVIDSTEAVVAIDVNSGKFRDHSDAETTAFKTDMEAADEIPRQLKLRDLGGVIICDFIDLRYERHRRDLEMRLHENFKNDRAKTKVLRMSQFGIIELTRQRMRPSLKRSIYFDCPHCKGAGLVKTPESMSLDIMRKLGIALHDLKVVRAQLSIYPEVASYLLNKKRASLAALEARTGKKVVIIADISLGLDEQKFELLDSRDGLVVLEEIGMTPPVMLHGKDHRGRPAPAARQGGRGGPRQNDRQSRPDNRRDQRGRPGGRDAEREEPDEDRLAIERGEDAVDQREEDRGEIPGEPPLGREEDSADAPTMLETASADEASEQMGDEPDHVDDKPPVLARNAPPRPNTDQRGPAEDGDGPRRGRRRGRRGGRGRGRGQGTGPQADAPPRVDDRDPPPPPAAPPQDIEPSEEDEVDGNRADAPDSGNALDEGDQPRRRRRRRGGRRHRRRNENDGPNDRGPINQNGGGQSTTVVQHRPVQSNPSRPNLPVRTPPPRPALPPIQPPVVRTGSADKHLASDEPVAPQPATRPHSYRDLDAIPDDYD